MAKLSFGGVITFGDIFKNQQKNILLFHFFGFIFAPVNQKEQVVRHTVALPFLLKSTSGQKEEL
jgi:hypothetical protein